MIANKTFKILLTNFSTVKKKLPEGMVIIYARRSPAIQLAVTGSTVAGICEPLHLMVNQARNATIRQSQSKITDRSFVASDMAT